MQTQTRRQMHTATYAIVQADMQVYGQTDGLIWTDTHAVKPKNTQ